MSDYTTRVLEQVRAKNAHEPEFLQAVQEVISTIEPVLSANKKYEDNCILERIVEPERTIIFRVPSYSKCFPHEYNVQIILS